MIIIKELGLKSYEDIWNGMKLFTSERSANTCDEIWLVQHPPVYTQGQAGKAEHVINAHNIPIIQSDRGGQITYHGPGQLIAYVLIDLTRRKLGIRTLVSYLEKIMINLLADLSIKADTRLGAPGVYTDNKKIGSIGLRVKKGATYHGMALNVAMNLQPFEGINPCGYAELKTTQIRDYIPDISIETVQEHLIKHFNIQFGC